MVPALILLALLQDPNFDLLVARLDHQDATVRQKAVGDLIARGPGVVAKILALHRSTTSANVRSSSESVLLRFAFVSFAATRPEEPLHKTLHVHLLKDLEVHRTTDDCWLGKEKQPALDASKLRIKRQSGSGHGQTLQIEDVTSDGKGGFTIRRVALQRTTPYRPTVKEDGVRVQEAQLDPDESRALASLLVAVTKLRSGCALEEKEGAQRWRSTADFTTRLQIESAGQPVWKAAYTGYPGTMHEKEYVHGEVVDDILQAALSGLTWRDAKLSEQGSSQLLEWISENFKVEKWWVKERYIAIAGFVGDQAFLPLLERVAAELKGKQGASEERQLQGVLDAIKRITGNKKQQKD